MHVDLVIKVPDVAQNGVILHGQHLIEGNDPQVTGGGDHNIRVGDGLVDRDHRETIHEGLQGIDRVCLRDFHTRTLARHRLGAALTDVTITANQHVFAAHQHVGGAVDAVNQGMPGAVLVVELGLGHRVVDVHRGERQHTFVSEVVQAVHARGGFLRHALHGLADPGPTAFILGHGLAQHAQEGDVLIRIVGLCGGHNTGFFELRAPNHGHGGIPAIVQNHVRKDLVALIISAPGENLVQAPPVLVEGFPLPGEDRHTLRILGRALPHHHGSRSLILSGENIARRPAHLRPQRHQRFNQHSCLHSHVNGTRDASPLQWLLRTIFPAQLHQAGHLILGESDLMAASIGQCEVRDLEVHLGLLETVGMD